MRLKQHSFAVAFFVGVAMFIVWTQRTPVQLIGSVWTENVQRGGTVTEIVTVQRFRSDCEATVDAEIEDFQTTRFRLAPIVRNPPLEIGIVNVENEFSVPFAASWGRAYLRVRRTYECWPFFGLLPIRRPVRVLEFQIVPETKKD